MDKIDATELPDGYDPRAFDHPSVSVDVVALTIRDRSLQVLLVQRSEKPYPSYWAIPGGFVPMQEDLDTAAERKLREKTGVGEAAPFLEQLYTFGKVNRDPRDRVITVAYYALLPAPDSGLPNAPSLGAPIAGANASDAQWFDVKELPPLAFDHAEILQVAITRLQGKLGYTSVAYALLADEFTLTELQTVYETILDRTLDKRNFRKKMLSLDILEATGKERRLGAHRPAQLFRWTKREPVFLP
ncbi:MAG: NUDIX hydrolase [Armatimonadetes bacterium]|nr:NUDIX hydrolase [Armatimonadota bacterium]